MASMITGPFDDPPKPAIGCVSVVARRGEPLRIDSSSIGKVRPSNPTPQPRALAAPTPADITVGDVIGGAWNLARRMIGEKPIYFVVDVGDRSVRHEMVLPSSMNAQNFRATITYNGRITNPIKAMESGFASFGETLANQLLTKLQKASQQYSVRHLEPARRILNHELSSVVAAYGDMVAIEAAHLQLKPADSTIEKQIGLLASADLSREIAKTYTDPELLWGMFIADPSNTDKRAQWEAVVQRESEKGAQNFHRLKFMFDIGYIEKHDIERMCPNIRQDVLSALIGIAPGGGAAQIASGGAAALPNAPSGQGSPSSTTTQQPPAQGTSGSNSRKKP